MLKNFPIPTGTELLMSSKTGPRMLERGVSTGISNNAHVILICFANKHELNLLYDCICSVVFPVALSPIFGWCICIHRVY
jgi:hypothetical protein